MCVFSGVLCLPWRCRLYGFWVWCVVAVLGMGEAVVVRADDVDCPPAPPAGRLLPGGTNVSKYFCVFGPQAKRRIGAADTTQLLFFRLPRETAVPLVIHVFDPGSRGGPELEGGNPKEPTTVFTVYGGAGASTDPAARAVRPTPAQAGEKLAEYVCRTEARASWVTLGSFDMGLGEPEGETVVFKLAVVGTTGSATNLFRVAVSPATADAFTYELSANMAGSMCFYVDLPDGCSTVTEHNFDLDWGSVCRLGSVRLRCSGNGRWVANTLSIPLDMQGVRVPYRVSKHWGRYNNTAFYFTDDSGKALPIYFTAGPPSASPTDGTAGDAKP